MLWYGHKKQQNFRRLNKTKMIGAPAMALPDSKNKFELYVCCSKYYIIGFGKYQNKCHINNGGKLV